jgi:hypothetical protein
MTQLAQDMHTMNARVEKLTEIVEKKHAATEHTVDMEHPAERRGASADVSSDAASLEEEVNKYKKEARAEKQV